MVADIAEIHLDTGNLDLNGLVVLVGNLLAAPSEVLVTGDLKDVGHEVVTLKNQILNDGIKLRVGVLNAGDGNVGNVLHDGRNDDISQVLDQMRLEDGLAVVIIAKVGEQLLAGLTKGLVLRIAVKLLGKELDLVDDTVGVTAVLVAEQESAVVVELVPLLGGLVLEDEPLLKEAAADVVVHALEPVLKLTVVISVTVNLGDGVPKIRSRGTVGKALNQSSEALLGSGEAASGLLAGVGRLLANMSAVAAVLLGEVEKGLDGLSVVGVLLAFENHLLQAPDGLLLALLRHLLVKILTSAAAVLLVALEDALLGLTIGVVVESVLDDILGGVLAGGGVSVADVALAREALNTLRVLEALDTLLVGVLEVLVLALDTLVTGSGGVDASGSGILGVLLGVALVEALSLVLQLVLGQVGGVMPGVVIGGTIHLVELVVRGANLVGSVGGGITGHVAEKDGSVVEKLSELAVGDEQRTECPQTLKSVLAVRLGGILADGSVGGANSLGVELLSLPDELLEEIALVLAQKQVLGLSNDILRVLDEGLAFCGEVVGGIREALGAKEAVEGDVDLVVLDLTVSG